MQREESVFSENSAKNTNSWSMSDTGSEAENSNSDETVPLTLNAAYHLRKSKIISELKSRGIAVDENDTRDTLRGQLVALVKNEIAARSKESTEKNTVSQQVTSAETTDGNESDDSNSSMASDTKVFFKESDDWESFIERLEYHFIAKKIETPEMKRAVLMTSIDEATYKLIKALCAPKKPSEHSFDEITKLVENQLKPKPSELMERYKFNRARQEPTESIAEFAAKLRQLAINCNFETNWKTAMRDQFACGIRDDSTRFELFKDKTITFEKALEEALAREEATKNAAGAAQSSTSRTYKQENFALDERRKESKRRAKQRTHEDRQQSAERQCFCCGKKGHATNDCKYRDRKCDFCHKKGHLERACIKKKNLSNKFLEHNSSASDSEPGDSESESMTSLQ